MKRLISWDVNCQGYFHLPNNNHIDKSPNHLFDGGWDFCAVMGHFLERISLSEYKDNFILKGGMLVAAMVGLDARSTMNPDATVKPTTAPKTSRYPCLFTAIATKIAIFSYSPTSCGADRFHPHRHTDTCRYAADGYASLLCGHRLFYSVRWW